MIEKKRELAQEYSYIRSLAFFRSKYESFGWEEVSCTLYNQRGDKEVTFTRDSTMKNYDEIVCIENEFDKMLDKLSNMKIHITPILKVKSLKIIFTLQFPLLITMLIGIPFGIIFHLVASQEPEIYSISVPLLIIGFSSLALKIVLKVLLKNKIMKKIDYLNDLKLKAKQLL